MNSIFFSMLVSMFSINAGAQNPQGNVIELAPIVITVETPKAAQLPIKGSEDTFHDGMEVEKEYDYQMSSGGTVHIVEYKATCKFANGKPCK